MSFSEFHSSIKWVYHVTLLFQRANKRCNRFTGRMGVWSVYNSFLNHMPLFNDYLGSLVIFEEKMYGEKAEEQWKTPLAKDSQRSFAPSVRGKMPEECVSFCVSVYSWTSHLSEPKGRSRYKLTICSYEMSLDIICWGANRVIIPYPVWYR